MSATAGSRRSDQVAGAETGWRPGTSDRIVLALGVVLLIAAFGWAAWAYSVLRTYAVTGSDPYAYAQMAIDLARRGTLLHAFPLANVARDLGLPSWPTVHVGYHLPLDRAALAASDWPPGASVLLAGFYLALGEAGLYLATPLIGLLCLVAVAWLAAEISGGLPFSARWLFVGAGVFISASEYRQVESAVVPLADLPAQFFTLLALAAAWRGVKDNYHLTWAALVGLAVGAAYDMRYTQLLILAPVIARALLWRGPAPIKKRFFWLAICGTAALLAAAPDLYYHQIAFGNPLTPGGTAEVAKFSPEHVPGSLWLVVQALFARGNEYLYLAPFLAVGLWAAWRRERAAFFYLGGTFAFLLGFQLLYPNLLLRDVLPVLPLLSLLAAYGIAGAVESSRRRKVLFLAALISVVFAFGMRGRVTLAQPLTGGISAYSRLTPLQRAGFQRLSQMLPSNAQVGCSLNSGAVEFYTGKPSFRPAFWSADQLATFVLAQEHAGVRTYFLDDGTQMGDVLQWARANATLIKEGDVDLPYFVGDGHITRPSTLYQVVYPPVKSGIPGG